MITIIHLRYSQLNMASSSIYTGLSSRDKLIKGFLWLLYEHWWWAAASSLKMLTLVLIHWITRDRFILEGLKLLIACDMDLESSSPLVAVLQPQSNLLISFSFQLLATTMFILCWRQHLFLSLCVLFSIIVLSICLGSFLITIIYLCRPILINDPKKETKSLIIQYKIIALKCSWCSNEKSEASQVS